MDYKQLKRLIGALTCAAPLVSIVWIILGKDIQGMGLIAVAGLMVLAGALLLFAPGEEPKSVLSKLVEEVKDVKDVQGGKDAQSAKDTKKA